MQQGTCTCLWDIKDLKGQGHGDGSYIKDIVCLEITGMELEGGKL